VLRRTEDELQEKAAKSKASLEEMKSYPGKFHNPLKLFEVRLCQIERMNGKNKVSPRV
jgi:predicted FMN-binding regulatory protein PaiB